MPDNTIMGRIELNAGALRKFLAKSHYYLSYDRDRYRAVLCANDGGGGVELFALNDVPYVVAQLLAKELGLEGDGPAPTSWHKWNPTLGLDHDGSADAEELRVEMLKLGVPHKICRVRDLALIGNGGRHTRPMWDQASMLKIIRDTAERYKKQLESTP